MFATTTGLRRGSILKLIRLLAAMLAMSFAFTVVSATAEAGTKIPASAKKKCNKLKTKKQKKACLKKARKKANKQARHALNNPAVTIRTTEYGIPRIVADNYRGLGFGYGYALARENICSMADIYTTNRGERHGVRLRDLGLGGVIEPAPELFDRVGHDVGQVQ